MAAVKGNIYPTIRIEGLKELQAGLRNAENKLPKALGEAHKEIGRFIIGKIPQGSANAVGAGSGSELRASATKRDVILRAGSAHRAAIGVKRHIPTRFAQWGKTEVQPFAKRARPYIVGFIEKNADEIMDVFAEEYRKVLEDACYQVKMY
jgi:hypothetical protein